MNSIFLISLFWISCSQTTKTIESFYFTEIQSNLHSVRYFSNKVEDIKELRKILNNKKEIDSRKFIQQYTIEINYMGDQKELIVTSGSVFKEKGKYYFANFMELFNKIKKHPDLY